VDSPDGLEAVTEPGVVAAVWMPPVLPDWHRELVTALREHRFSIPRLMLTDVTAEDVACRLRREAGAGALTASTLDALCDDVAMLVQLAADLSGSQRLLVRLLTATPNTHCGYHVDTARPGAAPWGVLKTYHGAGTTYVDPAYVSSTRDFYRYLSRRERLVRELDAASGPDGEADRLRAQIASLDADPGFYSADEAVAVAPAWAVVAFKHLDASLMWGRHRPDLAWIHCSPMGGEPRLVVNVTGRDALPGRASRRAGASPR
jgi:hypothetical protein